MGRNESGTYSAIGEWIGRQGEYKDLRTGIQLNDGSLVYPEEFSPSAFSDGFKFIIMCCHNRFAGVHPDNSVAHPSVAKRTLLKEDACKKDNQYFDTVFSGNAKSYSPDSWHDSYRHHKDWFVLDQGEYTVSYHKTEENKEELVDKIFKAEK